MKDEQTELLSLEHSLAKRVVGQDSALNAIAQRLRASKTGLAPENGPQGVFLLVGPSGTGKTETALALADELFGGEKSLITINLSEYQEPHTVSQLKGSPPGYVGYGQGGILTEAVRKRPYSVVLLDEVEKAHQDVMNLFYQVFDRGFMRDGEGREIDFRNTVILMSALTEGGLNRYRLDIPSCTALLDVETFTGKEFISELYHYQVIFTSSDQNISSAQLLTKPATLTMGTGPLMELTGQKVVHGVVTHFKRISGSCDQATYQIIIEPYLSLLRKQFRTRLRSGSRYAAVAISGAAAGDDAAGTDGGGNGGAGAAAGTGYAYACLSP